MDIDDVVEETQIDYPLIELPAIPEDSIPAKEEVDHYKVQRLIRHDRMAQKRAETAEDSEDITLLTETLSQYRRYKVVPRDAWTSKGKSYIKSGETLKKKF